MALVYADSLKTGINRGSYTDSIKSLCLSKITNWEATAIEIEGMNGHVHGEGCNHDHKHKFQLTDAQMLEVQKDFYDRIHLIRDSIDYFLGVQQ